MTVFLSSVMLILLLNPFTLSAQEVIPDDDHDYLITLETGHGNIIFLLFDDTPLHKENFVKLAKAGVYDGIIFHRVINNFMIQSGDPTTSNITPGWEQGVIPPHVPAEFNSDLKHRRGSIGAARYGGERNPEKNSSPTQFYIVQNERAAPHLDGEYTVFGQVMSGLEVIDIIAGKPTDDRDRPIEETRINRVKVDTVKREDILRFYNYSYK